MRVLRRLNGLHRAALAAVFGLLLGSLVLLGPAPTAAADVSVNIVNFAFVPATITVPVGTTVLWTNQDFVVHTVTSDTGVWDSGSLSQGKSFSYTFNTPGTYAYHCIPHPYMMATVTVTAAGASSGTSAAPAAASGGFADPAFQQLWAKTDANPSGRSYIWGPAPFTGGVQEDYKEAPGGKRLVQYFDKARMELNTPGGPVTAGLLRSN